MIVTRNAALVGVLSFVAACAANQPSVPVVGASADLAALAGSWTGEYSSAASGRSGSISFSLRADGDSATGDVLMIPVGWGRPLLPWRGEAAVPAAPRVQAEVLTINFVRVQQGHVNGTLAPYADPQTGERLITTFTGELKGDAIEGTYTTRLASGETQTGRWSVQRK